MVDRHEEYKAWLEEMFVASKKWSTDPPDPNQTQPHFLTQEEIDAIFNQGGSGWQPDPWYDAGEPIKPAVPKCECGAAKTWGENTNIHSYWCPVYKKWK